MAGAKPADVTVLHSPDSDGNGVAWIKVGVLFFVLQTLTVSLISGLTYEIVRHHKDTVVKGGVLFSQGDNSGTPLATAAAYSEWEGNDFLYLGLQELNQVKTLIIQGHRGKTHAEVHHIKGVEVHPHAATPLSVRPPAAWA